jgi:hypothetical protein
MDMELRNNNDFTLPLIRRELFRKSPLYSLPYEWNHCGDVKFQHNRCTFKIALENELFDSLINEN